MSADVDRTHSSHGLLAGFLLITSLQQTHSQRRPALQPYSLPCRQQRDLRSIDKNAQPENRVYRYNFFYDNCTTRAREIILSNLGNQSTNFKDIPTASTYREEIHKLNGQHRWARFGNDLLLGCQADRPITQREWEFLPDNLSKDFATEGRTDFIDASQTADGKTNATSASGYITLVDETSDIIPAQTQITDDTPVTPQMIAIALAIIIIGTTVRECIKKKNYWWFDAILLVLTGLPGLILFTMIFSQHPTVQINFQILILNPLNLIFAWKTVKRMKAGRQYWYLRLHINMDGKTIPLIGSINVTKSTFIDYLDGEKPKIINVELLDEDNAKFEKFQPAGLDI